MKRDNRLIGQRGKNKDRKSFIFPTEANSKCHPSLSRGNNKFNKPNICEKSVEISGDKHR